MRVAFGFLLLLCSVVSISANDNLVEVTATLVPVKDTKVEGLSQIELKKELMIARSRGSKNLLQLSAVVESGKWAIIKRGREFWYPSDYSEAVVHKSAKDEGEYTVPSGANSASNQTVIYPNSPTLMSRRDLGAYLKVRPTVKEDGLIYLEGELRDMVFEGLSEEAIPISVKTRQLIKGSRNHDIMISRVDKPMFHVFSESFKAMLPYSAGTSEAARRLREAKAKYDYLIPVEMGNNVFGEQGRIDLGNATESSTGVIRSTMMKATEKVTMLRDKVVRRKGEVTPPRQNAILVLEVKKIKLPEPEKTSGGKLFYLTSKFIESEHPMSLSKPVMSESEYQEQLRSLVAQKGVDLLSAPSVVVKPGQSSKIEVIREFVFPTRFEEPSKGTSITDDYAKPLAFETRNTGVTLKADISDRGNGYIGIRLSTYLTEFEGFLNYGNPTMKVKTNLVKRLKPVVENENRVEMPVFPFRATETEVVIPNGSSVAVTMIFDQYNKDHQKGRLIKFRAPKVEEVTVPRYLTVFLKAQMVGESGKP